MKQRLFGLCLALALGASLARATDFPSCNAILPGDPQVDPNPQGNGCAVTPILSGSESITATLQAVNVATGLKDSTATSASTFVLQFRTCGTCQWISFPKAGNTPITNIGGGADAAPARAFKVPPHTYQVRWHPLTLDAGRVTGYVSY